MPSNFSCELLHRHRPQIENGGCANGPVKKKSKLNAAHIRCTFRKNESCKWKLGLDDVHGVESQEICAYMTTTCVFTWLPFLFFICTSKRRISVVVYASSSRGNKTTIKQSNSGHHWYTCWLYCMCACVCVCSSLRFQFHASKKWFGHSSPRWRVKTIFVEIKAICVFPLLLIFFSFPFA